MRYARTSNRSETARTNQDVFNVPGGLTGGATPVPIPNTEVKPSKADDTAAARQWESRTLPGYKKKPAGESQQAFLFLNGFLCICQVSAICTRIRGSELSEIQDRLISDYPIP
jgi:hypothetical protein